MKRTTTHIDIDNAIDNAALACNLPTRWEKVRRFKSRMFRNLTITTSVASVIGSGIALYLGSVWLEMIERGLTYEVPAILRLILQHG